MKSVTKFFILAALLAQASAFGQKSVTDQKLVWYGYVLNMRLNKQWYLQTEAEERHFMNPVVQHQVLVRTHLHRSLGNSGWETSAGMCLFLQNPNKPGETAGLTIPELRPHVEFSNKQTFPRFTLDHRYKAEARFFHNTNASRTELEDGFAFGNFRLRYRLQATIPIVKIDDKRSIKVKVSDEILVNAGTKIVTNMFDQNRIYCGAGIDLLPNLTFEAGYLNWFQQTATGSFFNRHILRFTLVHKINLQKQKSE